MVGRGKETHVYSKHNLIDSVVLGFLQCSIDFTLKGIKIPLLSFFFSKKKIFRDSLKNNVNITSLKTHVSVRENKTVNGNVKTRKKRLGKKD